MIEEADAGQPDHDRRPRGRTWPITNSHVHVPPNFSAFTTPQSVVEAATAEDVRALGLSNFFDQRVYADVAGRARAAGIVPLFGLEFITVVPELADQGIRVNDPANPGRMYFCGKGIDPDRRTDQMAALAARIRSGNDERAAAMVDQVARHLAAVGFDSGLTAAAIAQRVAERADVPLEWVSLQERHIAQGIQEALSTVAPDRRAAVLEAAYGRPSDVDPDDAVALQGEIRARLLKSGTVGFVPEVPLAQADAYSFVLAAGGIPTYPILADGADPVCPYEADPFRLADQLQRLGVWAAELIPIRNHSLVVDEYVKTLTDAGLIVMAGTEHNTLDRIPLEPACVDGPTSELARAAFYEAACVVAAHADLVRQGGPGYVSEDGSRVGGSSRVRDLAARGDAIIQGERQR
jgi:hypothetical protein